MIIRISIMLSLFCQKGYNLKAFLKNLLKGALLASLFSVCYTISLYSQDSRVGFSHLEVNDGLSRNWIKCIFKDSKGFVWFGTNSGLNRFDGYKCEVFQENNSDSTAIAGNDINVIIEDNEGNLGTDKGVSVLDLETYKFRRINLLSSSPLFCGDIAYITAMAIDPEGNILVGTHNGLFLINTKKHSYRHILIDEQLCFSQINSITAITYDNTSSFWIGASNGSIIKYNQNSNSFEKFESFRENKEISGSISKIFVDNEKNLWIAGQNGLNIFNTIKKCWDVDFLKKYGKVFANVQITGIDQDADNLIWVATDGLGAFIFDQKYSGLRHITSLPYVKGTLSSNGIASIYCDKTGIVWVGTAKNGVDFYTKNIRKFRLFRNYPTDPNSLSNNDVDCVTEDINGNIWIGTNGGGLNYYSRKDNKFVHYFSKPVKSNGLSSNIIVSVYEDSDQKIWIGTYFGGLNCLDTKNGKFTIYRHSDSDSTSLSDDRVWDICEDSQKNLWVATLTSGLNRLDRRTGKFRRFNAQNSPICFNYIKSIATDGDDNLWISSTHGLIFFDPVQNRAKCYYNNPETSSSISDNHIISTYKDSRGLFWVCTNNGLNLMDQLNDSFRVFREADGLPSNCVFRIREDNNSNLWISTNNGLSKLIITKKDGRDSLSFNFVNFGMSDGLQGKEFNETAALKTRDGELWFGGLNGLNAFYPHDITKDNSPSKIVITNFRIDNEIVRCGEVINNRILLDKPIFNTDKIILKYKENSFTVDFVALNYFFPENNKYAFSLEGFNDKWIITEGQENFATFSNLKHGKYTFKVKGTNSDGIWNDLPTRLTIQVLPPIWASWYAYVVYFILILSSLLFLRYLTLARERLKTQIEQEYIESQHIHEIDAMKINFFTNISHEFRTPLSLIISPLEKLMVHWKNKPEEKNLNLILQNAKRLLFMVNQLLDFRKMEVQGFEYNTSYGNIVVFLEHIVSSFNDLSEQKHIQLSFHSDINKLNTLFDKDKLEKIMFNLLSNAFKFTPVNGKVSVTILPEWAGNKYGGNGNIEKISHLAIKVEDTGIGIPKDKIDKLFIGFYQVDTAISRDQGYGIGLSLVKEFVKLHDGEISVKSEPGKGSCFTVILPVAVNGNTLSENSSLTTDKQEYFAKSPSLIFGTDSNNVSKGKPTLLIAEDDTDLRFYIKDNLLNQYNVYEAENGEEALAIILKTMPDLIISDIIMPGIDGIELCRRVKTDKNICHIPVILLTARSAEGEQFENLETGADDCILKPFNFQILEAKISNLINSRRNLREVFRKNLKIEPNDITITSLDEQFINKALDLIEKNIAKSEYTVEELSRELGMSRTLLYKKILAITGKAPLEFIRTLRLKRAAQLLLKSQLHVSEIAYEVGFNDPKYFRKHFKNEFGVLPSRYSEKFKFRQE
jgi:signal transduction histidine kinase/ligand-binding sensor domain-containing protein/DNA-binding response OmpR family regulator